MYAYLLFVIYFSIISSTYSSLVAYLEHIISNTYYRGVSLLLCSALLSIFIKKYSNSLSFYGLHISNISLSVLQPKSLNKTNIGTSPILVSGFTYLKCITI